MYDVTEEMIGLSIKAIVFIGIVFLLRFLGMTTTNALLGLILIELFYIEYKP